LDVPNNRYTFQKAPGGPVITRQFNSSIGFASAVLGSTYTDDTVFLTVGRKSSAGSPVIVVLYFGPRGNPLVMGTGSSAPTVPSVPLDAGAYIALVNRTGVRIDVTISQVIGSIGMHWHSPGPVPSCRTGPATTAKGTCTPTRSRCYAIVPLGGSRLQWLCGRTGGPACAGLFHLPSVHVVQPLKSRRLFGER
jgi:hypothetical protein